MLNNRRVHRVDQGAVLLFDGATLELQRRRHHAVVDGEGLADEAEVADLLVRSRLARVAAKLLGEALLDVVVFEQCLFGIIGQLLFASVGFERIDIGRDQRREVLASLADDHDLIDARDGRELLFDGAGVDVFAALRDDHVLDAVGDAEVALFEAAYVARVVPAVGVDGFARGGLIVPVALHDVRPFDDDLAFLRR